MPWRPNFPGEFPTLGWYALEWITENLAQPDNDEYAPLRLTREQAQFVLQWYRLDPVTGRLRYRRGVWSRPKGHGKSPLMGALAALEGLADIVPDGWDADGRPVGRPWRTVRTPKVQLAAVSEDQTANSYEPLLEMLRQGPVLENYPGVDPMETFVALPRGSIEFVTSAARTREGNRPVFAAMDQTEQWVPSNGGRRLADVLRRNAGKIGGRTLETPNAYLPGDNSVAEKSASYWSDIQSGRTLDDGLLYDHREAPPDTDLADRDSLRAGLLYAYGDSAEDAGGWVDIDRIVAEIWDPATDPQDARRFYLNQITHASDSWLSQPAWNDRTRADKIIATGDTIVLGFDGSKGRNRGKADATALVGCRVEDGHLFEIKVWEQGPADGRDWAPNPIDIDREVRRCFDDYQVVGFYADPSGWTEWIAKWEAAYGRRLRVKASHDHPIMAWPRGKDSRVVEYVERLRLAVVNREMTHDGATNLARHVLNARRRAVASGYLIYKKYPDSPDKIDAAYAAVMAWKARTDALAKGVGAPRKRRKAVF